MTAPLLVLDKVEKRYDDFVAVKSIDLTVEAGEFIAIMGPSGCGKTTTLRMIAGLEVPTSGEIRLRGRRLNDVAPWGRETPLVWQSLALFPFLNVRQNVEFGLKMRGVDTATRRAKADRWLEQLGLGNVKFLGGDGVCTAEIAKLSGNAKTLENVVCATGGASLDKMPGGTAWKAKYDKLYPGQFQVYSPYTYDATYVLVDAMKRADSTDPKVYKAKLPSTDYQGVTARIQFEPNGELKNAATTLSTYKDGKKVSL